MTLYSVVLSDPPWFYNNRKTGGERKNKAKFGGGAIKHYPLIKDDRLLRMARVLKRYTKEDAVLFMWVTAPRLDFAFEVLKAAGFKYKTVAFTWVKTKKDGSGFIYGPGFYTASNAEFCVIATKGKPPRPVKKMTDSVIMTPRMEHSRKPDLHEAIDLMYPELNKIEIFARRKNKPGWDFFGNQI